MLAEWQEELKLEHGRDCVAKLKRIVYGLTTRFESLVCTRWQLRSEAEAVATAARHVRHDRSGVGSDLASQK